MCLLVLMLHVLRRTKVALRSRPVAAARQHIDIDGNSVAVLARPLSDPEACTTCTLFNFCDRLASVVDHGRLMNNKYID